MADVIRCIESKAKQLDEKLENTRYSRIALLDSNILVSGQGYFDFKNDMELERHFYRRLENKIDGFRFTVKGNQLYDIDRQRCVGYLDEIIKSNIKGYKKQIKKGKISSCRKITDSIPDWRCKKTETIIGIPDFIFAETESTIINSFLDIEKYEKWHSALIENENSEFIKFKTKFIKYGENKNGFRHKTFNGKLTNHEREKEILFSTDIKYQDICDQMLFFSALEILYKTDLEGVYIVTNDRAFHGRTKEVLKQKHNRREDGKYVKIYSSDDFCSKLQRKGTKLS